MIASKLYNEKEGHDESNIYSVFTSGNIWKFIKDNEIYIDVDDYGIKEIQKIIGILSCMVEQKASLPGSQTPLGNPVLGRRIPVLTATRSRRHLC
jgi:hypothetical protein